ncbi:unnamed protein product [Moneuplotes crassus]|uniref:Uncharacterized protein n=1 Tax=Euplotes crassus TaxID=5936 RepID=A0AAD1U0N9_EUPCR|nr:unnamed protein product [Moneuplotes crassus]
MYSSSKATCKKSQRTVSTPKAMEAKKFRKGCKVCIQCKTKEFKGILKTARKRRRSNSSRKHSLQKSSEKPINARIVTSSETQETYVKTHDFKIFTPRKAELLDSSTQVHEKDLGLDTFATEIENNKTKFVSLIEGIVGNMSKEYESMIKEKEKYSHIIQKIDPSTYITQIDQLKSINGIQSERISTLEAQNSSLAQKLEACSREIETFDNQLALKNQEISNYKIESQNQEIERKSLKQKIDLQLSESHEKQELEVKYKQELENALTEIDKLTRQNQELEHQLQIQKSSNDKLQQEVDNTRQKHIDTQKELTAIKNDFNTAQEEANICKLDNGTLKEQLERYKSDSERYQNEIQQNKIDTEQLLKAIEDTKLNSDSLQTIIRSKEEGILKLQEEISFLKDILNKETTEKEEALKKSLPEDIEKISTLQAQIESNKTKLAEYEEKINKLDQDNEFLQNLLKNKEEVTQLKKRYTYVSNLLTSAKDQNFDPQVINYAENMISDGKSIFTKDDLNSLINEEDLALINQRLPSMPNDYDTYNLSRTNSEAISFKNFNDSPVKLQKGPSEVEIKAISDLSTQLEALKKSNKELKEQIEFRNRYIKQLEEANEINMDSMNDSQDNVKDQLAYLEDQKPILNVPEEESFDHSIAADSFSDDGGLELIEKEDMLQYLHTVSNMMEDML